MASDILAQKLGALVTTNSVQSTDTVPMTTDSGANTFRITRDNYLNNAQVNTLSASNLNVGTLTVTNLPVFPSFSVATLPAAIAGGQAWADNVITPWGTGELVVSDGANWRLPATKILVTADVPTFIQNCLRVGWSGTTPKTVARIADWHAGTSTGDPIGTPIVSGSGAVGSSSSLGSTVDKQGLLLLSTGTTTNGYCQYVGPRFFANTTSYAFQSWILGFQALPDGTENWWAFIGWGSATAFTTNSFPTACVGFLYDRYGAVTNLFGFDTTGLGFSTNNWLAITRDASVTSVSDTGLAPSVLNTFGSMSILHTSTACTFYTNGVASVTNSANIPLQIYGGVTTMNKTLGTTSRSMYVDLYYSLYRHGIARTLF